MKNSSPIISVIICFVLLLSGCSQLKSGPKTTALQPKWQKASHISLAPNSRKIRQMQQKLIYEPPQIFDKNPNTLLQKSLFDNCPGLMGYQGKPFFDAMVSDLSLDIHKMENVYTWKGITIEPQTNLNSPDVLGNSGFFGSVNDVCYSAKLNTILLLVSAVELGQGPFGVIEYDIEKRKAAFIKASNLTITAPLQFGSRGKNLLEIKGNWCGNVLFFGDLQEFLKDGFCFRSLYMYDLSSKKIKKMYENKYKPTLKDFNEYMTLRNQ